MMLGKCLSTHLPIIYNIITLAMERNEVIVTDETRIVPGVTTTVVWDRVWRDNGLIEETYDWYAQDRGGNVWYSGD
jgi:hypothetical protein